MLRLALIATLWVTACTGETVSEPGTFSGTWILEEIDGTPFAARASLTFPGDGSLHGRAPCNSFGGSLAADYPDFGLGGIRITRSMCADIAAEREFLGALGAMETAEISGDKMVLSSGSRRMVFRAGQP